MAVTYVRLAKLKVRPILVPRHMQKNYFTYWIANNLEGFKKGAALHYNSKPSTSLCEPSHWWRDPSKNLTDGPYQRLKWAGHQPLASLCCYESSRDQCADGPIEFNIMEAAWPSTLYFFKFVLLRTTLLMAIYHLQINKLVAVGCRLCPAVSNFM